MPRTSSFAKVLNCRDLVLSRELSPIGIFQHFFRVQRHINRLTTSMSLRNPTVAWLSVLCFAFHCQLWGYFRPSTILVSH